MRIPTAILAPKLTFAPTQGVRCAAAVGGESAAARTSSAAGPRLGQRSALDPHEPAKLSRRTVMGASIAELRSDDGIGKSRRGLTP